MISGLWLIAIIPISVLIGIIISSLLKAGSRADLEGETASLKTTIEGLYSELKNRDMVIAKLQENKRLEPMAKRINNEKFQEVFKDMQLELNKSYLRIKNLASLVANCPQSEYSDNLEKNIWGKIEKED